MPAASVDVAVIGGGFYGVRIATMTASGARTTSLFERDEHFLGRASFVNQARVHGGYHYPRSVLTALRARQLYARFHRDFAAAIGAPFVHLYAIARTQTHVGAREFEEFCRRIEAPLSTPPQELIGLFNPHAIERAFVAEESVFDAHKLADLSLAAAIQAGVQFCPQTTVVAVEPGHARRLRLRWQIGDRDGATDADWVINATYSALNTVLASSGVPSLRLTHELAEIVMLQPPAILRGLGVTVMDGPFWSCLPFPSLNAYSLTHVRYTPHERWGSDSPTSGTEPDAAVASLSRESHAPLMLRDAARYIPAMSEARQAGSLWEVKTVLPRSDGDDGRPILVRQHEAMPGLVSVLGGKIDSVYDVEDELRDLIVEA